MKILKILLSFSLTLATTLLLNNSITIGETNIPPMGKFLSPFEGFWQNGKNKDIDLPEKLALAGLQSTVNVYFDELLIPHIFAQNDADLYKAQGFITAYHRLWQMEFQLYATEGRISEILGKKALDYDRTKRRLGMKFGAKKSEKLLQTQDPELYQLVEAYADGVNAYIETLAYKDYPIEYKLLDYKPEKWTAFKTFLLLKEMSDQLSRGEKDFEHTNALKIWGKDTFDILYPERHPNIDPVIPKDTKWNFEPIEIPIPQGDYPLILTEGSLSKPDPQVGSNSFVVNGKKTKNGTTILSNEPDLRLNLPSIWYIAHLNSPNRNVMGSTIPGAPGIVLGFNDSVAWGFTNAKRDLVDWYFTTFKNKDKNEYLYGNKWLKTKKIVEEIKIKGEKSFFDTITYTHYGPVVYDESFHSDKTKQNFSMRWTAHDESLEFKALHNMNRAENYDDFVDAFQYYTGPPQNMSFASVNGDIALWINGKFPVKWEEQGKFLLDGSNPTHDWSQWMPRSHLYKVKNPPQNFVSSANQHPGDGTYPYYDFDYNFEYFRNRRINERLRLLNAATVTDVMALQNDNFNYIASESLPLMIAALDTTTLNNEEIEMINNLKKWDYFNHPDSKNASVFELWWDFLYDLIWDEMKIENIALYPPTIYNTIFLLKNQPDFPFFDIKNTKDKKENTQDLMHLSLEKALDSLAQWKKTQGEDYAWYLFKNTTAQHLLRIPVFSKSKIKIGGNHNIVNAASATHGPSWRMVVELSEQGVQAWGIYPGSQTGNPGNPTYANLIERWASGKYEPMLFKKNVKSDSRIVSQHTFSPKN